MLTRAGLAMVTSMPGRDSSLCGSRSGTGTDKHYVPLGQAACYLCSFSRTGVACCLPTCAQGSSAAVVELVGSGVFGGAPRSFVRVGGISSASLPSHVYRARVTQVCPSLGRRSVGALSAWPAGSSLVCTKVRPSFLGEWMCFSLV